MSSAAFGTGDLVEVETDTVRAIARVRESSAGGRLHIAFEMGEYLPWVDGEVRIRHFGNDVERSSTATILHAGSSTALLQLSGVAPAAATAAVSPADSSGTDSSRPSRPPLDTIPSLD